MERSKSNRKPKTRGTTFQESPEEEQVEIKKEEPDREQRAHEHAQDNYRIFGGDPEAVDARIVLQEEDKPCKLDYEYTPTNFERNLVRRLNSFGFPIGETAAVLGLTDTMLKRHFKFELSVGQTMRNLRVAETAYQLAVSGRCFPATAFWLKTQAGWRETDKVEGSGKSTKDQATELRAALDAMDAMEEQEANSGTTH